MDTLNPAYERFTTNFYVYTLKTGDHIVSVYVRRGLVPFNEKENVKISVNIEIPGAIENIE